MTGDQIIIFDTTLRDGEQSPGCSMNTREKLEVARALVELGVDVIEAGFPIASPGDFEAVSQIASKFGDRTTICALARSREDDIDRAKAALAGAKMRRIHVFLATSAIHREFKLKMDKQQIVERAVSSVKRAKEFCDDIEFSPEDAVRTELDFLCEVVEKAIEAGAPGGYYNSPALDGSRPGIYYINLRDTAEWPKLQLPTLTYHEAVPGHHHQIALAQERANTPLLMKVLGFSAYSEGWGLYAEQLADEIGMYENDPYGKIGYLQSLMFRATRLVVDSGMHAKRWSREQAIRFMVDALGDAESAVTTEIERYCVWPGQACSYKLGHTKWVELRETAKATLGDRFDIKAFHDAGMNTGGVPLTVLERVITEWTAAQAAA